MVKLEEAPRLGGYHLVKELSRDRFGIHYLAQRENSERKLLLQLIDPQISGSENFIVRFELLKGILPGIQHPNVVRVEEMGRDGEVVFIVREHPSAEDSALLTLDSFDPNATANRHRTLESLFEGVAKAIKALSEVKNGYYREGIVHDLLVPSKVYIQFEQGLIGGTPKATAKVDGYWETFLFFGDATTAPIHYRMTAALSGEEGNAYEWEEFLSPSSRLGQPTSFEDTLYSLGALIHKTITGNVPRGVVRGLRESDPTLDPLWDSIQSTCFSPAADAIDRICVLFQEMGSARTQLSPEERKLKSLHIPEGMALVKFDEKVELGAADGPEHEQPRFRAKIRPFLMDIRPVTVEEYHQFQSRYQPSSYSSGDQHPATSISWTMAKAYLRWRDEREGLPPGTYRLPTEYEWEAAVRGTSGELYPWGNQPNQQRLFCGMDKEAGAGPVAQHPPGRFGLHDMLGNTWEWTESIYKPHPFSEHIERGYSAMLYVIKGGCWFTPLDECRASLRAAFPPHECKPNVGFRAVRPVNLDD